MKEEQKLLNLRDIYYKSYPVMRNITQLLRFRYWSYSNRDNPIVKEVNGIKLEQHHLNRYNRGHHHIEFFKTYNRFNLKDVKYLRLYLCLTTLKTDFPIFSRSGEKRKEMKEYISKNIEKYIDGFDMAYDFDLPKDNLLSFEDLKNEIMEFCEFFDKYKVSYSITFSGQRGFHFRIPVNMLHPLLQKDYNRVIKITKKIALFHNNLHIDTFGNDYMKLFKLPYSVDGCCPNFYVVLPLTKYQLCNFDLKFCELKHVFNNIKLIDKNKEPREMVMHNFTNIEEQYNNTMKMFQDIENW